MISSLCRPRWRSGPPEDHLASFLRDTVEEIDLSGFYAAAGGTRTLGSAKCLFGNAAAPASATDVRQVWVARSVLVLSGSRAISTGQQDGDCAQAPWLVEED